LKIFLQEKSQIPAYKEREMKGKGRSKLFLNERREGKDRQGRERRRGERRGWEGREGVAPRS